MILSDVAIKNRTTVMVMVVLIIVMGVMSYITLPRESTPDVKVPYIIVTTANPGAAPEDIESTITTKIENQLTGLKGKKEMRSVSSEGLSTITVEFLPDVDIDDALQRVKNKVDLAKPELPQDTDEPIDPVVMEISFADMPILTVNISGDISPARMKDIAERLEEEIEAVPGVLGVDVLGALEREIILQIDPDKVAQYGLTVAELMKFIPSENVSMTAGGLETTGMKLSVRVPGKFEDPSQINRIPIAVRNGKPIYLTDVATTVDTFKDCESFSRLDGERSITLAVKKRVGANIVDIAQNVKGILKVAQTMVPKGVIFTLTTDQSKQIALMISDLENNIFTSLILVVGVLMIFMGLRSSLIVATAIPLSMLMSFAIIQALGLTLNMVVLFSLILSLGMLVDNAIVIVENIYRFMEMGYGKKEAAMKATSEVAWPVIASTATTVAAFFPMLFWPGLMGDFMHYLPLTVIIVLTCSLIVAMMINPVICSIWGKPTRLRSREDRPSLFVRKYRSLLNIVLQRPGTTLVVATCLLISIITIYAKSGLGIELFPVIDPKEGIVNIRLPQGTNIKETDRLSRIIETRVNSHRKSDTSGQIDNFENIVTNVGTSGGSIGGTSESGSHTANITMVFPDYEQRVTPSADIITDVRKELEDFPGAEVKVERRKEGPPTGSAVTVRIIGQDMSVLEKLSDEVARKIQGTPNMVNMRSDLEAAKPELVFVTDRVQAALLSTDTNTISQFLKTAIFGTKVGEYQQFNDDYDIRLRPAISERRGVDDLLRLRVPTLTSGAVPLTSLGHFEYRPGLGTIHRINRKRVVTITAADEGRPGLEVLADVQKTLENMKLPAGYRIEYAGEKEEDDKARAFLSKAFIIALLLIVAILVAQFNTLSVPLIIMSTVILSLIGVFVGLLIFHQPFGVIMTGVGVISLAGVVVNNAIVLLDYTRQLQQRGYSLQDAAVEAGVTRLRPVLLTAGTTILGLIPMVTGISFDFHTMSIAWRSSSSQWWSSMAVAVIFGLGCATMLTLLVVPSLYVLTSKIAQKMGMSTAPQVHHKKQPNYEDY